MTTTVFVQHRQFRNIRLMRSIILPFLLLTLALLTTACNLTEAPTHKTYTYSTLANLPKDRLASASEAAYTYQAGETVPLSWAAQPGQDTLNSKPQGIKIDAGIVGPFDSIDALKKAISFDGNSINGQIQATIPAIQTNNWSDKTAEADLKLPDTLAPGYYMIVQRIQTSGQRAQATVPTGRIIKITTHS